MRRTRIVGTALTSVIGATSIGLPALGAVGVPLMASLASGTPTDSGADAGADTTADASEPEPTTPETTVPDTTVPDTTVPDTTVPETTVPETTVPETTVPETTVPDTTVPDTTVPDTTVPETTVPETGEPDACPSEAGVQAAAVPGMDAPTTSLPAPTDSAIDPTAPDGEPAADGVDTCEPDGTVPETTVPETTVPDTTVPETTVPDTTVPDTTVPETTVPDTTVPETTVPETMEATSGEPAPVPEATDRIDPADPSDGPVAEDDVIAADERTAVTPELPANIEPEPLTPAQIGVRASAYDGVYAEGVPVGVAMRTSRWLESGDDYTAQAPGSSASGAYQIIDSTWNGYQGYARAADAPPEVQDQFAYESFVAILKRHGNDVSRIPIAWYYPKALSDPALLDTVPVPEAGNVLTIREYQARWMTKFLEFLGEGGPVFLPADSDPLIPAIAFPVLGPVEFVDDWHFERDGGDRLHLGIDLIGEAGQPLRAAFDGTVSAVRTTDTGIAGVGISIARDDGVYANYFHLNDDTPGTADGAAVDGLRIHPELAVGTRVRAGQIIGYMGSTGNAGIPHLHFELRTVDRTPIAPYPAILEAVQREQCSVGIGPWSTQFRSPEEVAAELAALTEEQLAGLAELESAEPFLIEGPDGARWTISADGSVTASGVGALVAPGQANCTIVPEADLDYGTGAAGLALDLLPVDWWDDPSELAAADGDGDGAAPGDESPAPGLAYVDVLAGAVARLPEFDGFEMPSRFDLDSAELSGQLHDVDTVGTAAGVGTILPLRF